MGVWWWAAGGEPKKAGGVTGSCFRGNNAWWGWRGTQQLGGAPVPDAPLTRVPHSLSLTHSLKRRANTNTCVCACVCVRVWLCAPKTRRPLNNRARKQSPPNPLGRKKKSGVVRAHVPSRPARRKPRLGGGKEGGNIRVCCCFLEGRRRPSRWCCFLGVAHKAACAKKKEALGKSGASGVVRCRQQRRT